MKDAYYFSHDSNARNDTKILSMRCDYGIEGYGMYWVIIETLRDESSYKLKQDKSTSRAFAMQMQCTVERVDQFIKDCVEEYDLFESDGEHFWAESLLRRMEKLEETREKRKMAANKRWDKEKNNANAMQVHNKSNAGELQDSAKESKGKESKEEDIYRAFDHLSITEEEYSKLQETHKGKDIDGVLEKIENFAGNKKYKSLYLTANNWLKKEPVISNVRTFDKSKGGGVNGVKVDHDKIERIKKLREENQ